MKARDNCTHFLYSWGIADLEAMENAANVNLDLLVNQLEFRR